MPIQMFKDEQKKIHSFKPKLNQNTVKIILSKKKVNEKVKEDMGPIQKLIADSEGPFHIRDTQPDEMNTDLKIDIVSPKPFNEGFEESFLQKGPRSRNGAIGTVSSRAKSVFMAHRPSNKAVDARRPSFTKPLRSQTP